MKLKPLPKAILILAVVSAAGYVMSLTLKNRGAETPSVAAVPAPAVTTVSPGAVPTASAPSALDTANAAVQAAKEAAAPTPAPVLTPAPTNDAGLANVLGTTKK